MVLVAQWVEWRIVLPLVASSSLVQYPIQESDVMASIAVSKTVCRGSSPLTPANENLKFFEIHCIMFIQRLRVERKLL